MDGMETEEGDERLSCFSTEEELKSNFSLVVEKPATGFSFKWREPASDSSKVGAGLLTDPSAEGDNSPTGPSEEEVGADTPTGPSKEGEEPPTGSSEMETDPSREGEEPSFGSIRTTLATIESLGSRGLS